MVGELIFPGRERRVPGVFSVKRTVDVRLQMLNTCAHRKWLGNERYALSVQHSERIVRRMPHRQSQRSAGDIRAVDAYAVHSARMQLQAFKRREETHLAAQLQYAAAKVLYNSAELIRADVRLRLGQYVLRRAEFHEAFQHP